MEKWRREWDSNPRYGSPYGGFQDRCLKPLGHPSIRECTRASRGAATDNGAGMTANTTTLTIYQGPAGDHNSRALGGARVVGHALAARLAAETTIVGEPAPVLNAGWAVELEAARTSIQQMAATLDSSFTIGARPVSALTRCAVALATLPVVVRHRPDACVVWFDAHADLNTPATSPSGYLGGMALAGPLGLWDSGLGRGLAMHNVVMVGVRDADPPEQELMLTSGMRCVPADAQVTQNLRRAVDGRAVYVHLDCDVLEPGLVPTDYAVGGGLTLEQLRQAFDVLAECEPIGLEVAEYQDVWEAGDAIVSPAPLITALEPYLSRLAGR
jgi:arginase